MEILIPALIMLVGGAVRLWDGTGYFRPKLFHPNQVAAVVCLVAALWALNDPLISQWSLEASAWGLLFAAVAWLNLLVGKTNWEEWWMFLRFGVPGVIPVAILYFFGGEFFTNSFLIVPVAWAMAGACYTILLRIPELHRFHPTRICEFIAGALIYGSISFV